MPSATTEQRPSIVALPGDGVGPEVTAAAITVLEAAGARVGRPVDVRTARIGWAAIRTHGTPLPDDTLELCRHSDAVFLGAVGDPAADGLPPAQRPEAGLLRLRKELGCYANLRPARVHEALSSRSPLRDERVAGTDLLIVRELSAGLYYGRPRHFDEEKGTAVDTMAYSVEEVRRVAEVAFRLAADRRGRLVSVDKANVLESSRLWRRVVDEVALAYPGVSYEHMLVDRAAMELVLRPAAWDVWLTANLFGDVLSDEAAAVVGSIGLLGSASLGEGPALYEPVHGSAPELAGTGHANPVGAILSVAMMLRHSLDLPDAADAVDAAVDHVLESGRRTADVAGPGDDVVGTQAFAAAVAEALGAAVPARPGLAETGP